MTTLARLGVITRSLDTSLTSLARRPDIAVEVKFYRERIETIKSVDDFLGNDRVFRFAMKAFGLGDFSYAKAFMRRVLNEGTDAPRAFANQLTDGRYREFAETFNFQRYGETATIFDRTRQGTIDRYLRQSLEEEEGARNESVRLGLYFERKAGGIDGPFDILSDKALTQFIYTALGLPAATSAMNIDRQADLLSSRLDFTQLKSPESVTRLLVRFAALADSKSTAPSTAGQLLLPGAASAGIGVDLLLAVQRSRSGRL